MDELLQDDLAPELDRQAVENELNEVRRFVGTLKIEDLKDGSWFEKLLVFALSKYKEDVDADYFRRKYPNLPADAVVEQRIQLASRYAGIEGGLTSAAYSGAVLATIGSGGAASPLTVPGGVAAFAIDLTYLAQAQMKLAHDIAVLYRVPLNIDDPEDLWKLVRIAFAVKLSEGAGIAAARGVPAVVRPFVKRFYSKGVLATAKTLPIIGKYLLQRNVIKFAIPLVSVPTSVAVNYWTTKTTGQHAQKMMRTEAKLAESSSRIIEQSPHLIVTLWTMWMTMNADGSTTENQRTLLNHVTKGAREHGVTEESLEELRDVVEVDHDKVWAMLNLLEDLTPVYDATVTAVAVGGKASERKLQLLRDLAERGGIPFIQSDIAIAIKKWR